MNAAAPRGDAPDNLTVIYDGHCRLCLATVDRLGRLGSRAELSFISIQELEQPEAPVIAALQGVPPETLQEQMHAVDGDGQLYAGSDAVVRILRTVPGFRFAGWVYRLPGMSRLGDMLYRYIAKRRYDWFGTVDEGCSSGECRLPQHRSTGRRDQ